MNFTIEQAASVAHEANRAYCLSIGDLSQPTWQDAPGWQRDSAINGIKYHVEHPDSKPEDSHVQWLAQKEREGWAFGPVKNPEKKEHPCFVPYGELPSDQRIKDSIFTGIARAFAPYILAKVP